MTNPKCKNYFPKRMQEITWRCREAAAPLLVLETKSRPS